MSISKRKFLAFSVAAAALSAVVVFALAVAADLYLHHRAGRSAGLNRWGYRGPVVSRKQPGEVRVAMVGGSTAFGYGVTWNEAIPALLEVELNRRYPDNVWRGLNLGYNTEAAFAFLPNLEDFAYLDYDVAVLYEGYNDLAGALDPTRVVVRRQSPVFRATGYFPILPLVLREKAMALRTGGNIEAGYAQERTGKAQTVFRPNALNRTSADALDAASAVAESLGRQFDRLSKDEASAPVVTGELGCPTPWVSYCDAQYRAIRFLLDSGKRVLVVSQPKFVEPRGRERHEHQRAALKGMISRQFGSNSRVAYFSAADIVDLADRDLSFDQMHLGLDGNRLVAGALAEPVRMLTTRP